MRASACGLVMGQFFNERGREWVLVSHKFLFELLSIF